MCVSFYLSFFFCCDRSIHSVVCLVFLPKGCMVSGGIRRVYKFVAEIYAACCCGGATRKNITIMLAKWQAENKKRGKEKQLLSAHVQREQYTGTRNKTPTESIPSRVGVPSLMFFLFYQNKIGYQSRILRSITPAPLPDCHYSRILHNSENSVSAENDGVGKLKGFVESLPKM